jgi:2-methylcitrate dehydratase PrpD
MIDLTCDLAEFIGGRHKVAAPDGARRIAKIGFIDCAAVTLAGMNEPVSRILHSVLEPTLGKSALYFDKESTTDTLSAAWINGTAAHALDYDDVAFQSHPSAVLVSAICAQAQSMDALGLDMLDAYAVGYHVWAELARRERGALHLRGWHPTGVWGAVAAAAACARLLGLDARQSAYAIALGASQSSGLMANFGSMAKPFHAGRAAHSGVVAARLAQTGFTASTDAIEHINGLCHAVSEKGDIDLDTPVSLGNWHIQDDGLSLKKYPICYATHRAIDAVLALRSKGHLYVDQIERVTVYTNRRYATVLRNAAPRTGLEAKFSMQFAVASAVLSGRVGLQELQDDFVVRQDVQKLVARTKVDVSQGETNSEGSYEQVIFHMTGGETMRTDKVEFARGHAKVPLSEDELRTKFDSCAQWAGRIDQGRRLFEVLSNLELARARELTV